MSIVKPPKTIHTISKRDNDLEIVIPTSRKRFQIFFLSIWLIFWVIGELGVLGILIFTLFSGLPLDQTPLADWPPVLFLLVWLVGWTVGGGFALYVWAWQLAGKEKITINSEGFNIRRELFSLSRSKQYMSTHINGLRVSPEAFNLFDWSSGLRFWGIGGGVLAFDYGAKPSALAMVLMKQKPNKSSTKSNFFSPNI